MSVDCPAFSPTMTSITKFLLESRPGLEVIKLEESLKLKIKRNLNGVSLAGRWWPVWLLGIGSDPLPLLKKSINNINKRQNFKPGLPLGNFQYPCKFIAINTVK